MKTPAMLLLAATIASAMVAASAYPEATSMRAYVATGANSATQGYEPAFSPIPALGDLHKQYAGLPSQCELKIKVEASSVNPSDIHPTVAGAVLPHVMGSDLSGTVVATSGAGCTRFRVGDNVWGDIGANTHTQADGTKTKEQLQTGIVLAEREWRGSGRCVDASLLVAPRRVH